MKKIRFILSVFLIFVHGYISYADEHKTLAIGSSAPDFNLPGVDGKNYTLSVFQKI